MPISSDTIQKNKFKNINYRNLNSRINGVHFVTKERVLRNFSARLVINPLIKTEELLEQRSRYEELF